MADGVDAALQTERHEVRTMTTRDGQVVQWFGTEIGWRQVHHHGSIDNADALAAYQRAVRGALPTAAEIAPTTTSYVRRC